MSYSREVVFFLGASLLITCSVLANLTQAEEMELMSPVVSNRGIWHLWDNCPPDTYIVGMQLKMHEKRGIFHDDSALNGIKFFCDYLGNTTEKFSIVSGFENFGSYGAKKFCKKGVAIGFQLRSEEERGWLIDDTAANNVRLICSGEPQNEIIEGDGHDFGDWTAPQQCGIKQALCGYRSQIDHDIKSSDTTGVNNIKMRCCDIPDPAKECMPEDTLINLYTCDNYPPQNQTTTGVVTCTYSKKTGISYTLASSEYYSKLITTYAEIGFTLPGALSTLGINFEKKLGYSHVTNYTWSTSASEAWSEEISFSTTIDVDVGYTSTIFQVAGKCDFYSVKPAHIVVTTTKIGTNQMTITYL